MEVTSEGEIRTDERATLDFPIRIWVPSSSFGSHVHDQTPHVPGLLRLWTGIRVTERSHTRVCRELNVCVQCEQSCTESRASTCHRQGCQSPKGQTHLSRLWRGRLGRRLEKRGSSAMDPVLRPFLVRVRTLRALLAASLRKLLGMEPHDGDFASQRMCPFCGLITPRYETCCLECGKSLNPA